MTFRSVSRALQVTCCGLGAALVVIYFSTLQFATDDRQWPEHRYSVVRAASAAELTIMRNHRLRAQACDEPDSVVCSDEGRVPAPEKIASVR